MFRNHNIAVKISPYTNNKYAGNSITEKTMFLYVNEFLNCIDFFSEHATYYLQTVVTQMKMKYFS